MSEKGQIQVILDNKKIFKYYAILALIYLIFAILNTYPLVNHLGTKQLGDGGDGTENMWNLWWFKKAIIELHQNPYYTNYILYPNGTNLYLHTLTPLLGFFALFLSLLFGNNLILIYNIIALSAFVLAGIGMFSLAYYLTKNKIASFIAGYIFAFNPYMIGHALGHLNLFFTGFMPLFVLFYFKFHENPLIKNLILSSFFLILTNLCDFYQAVFLLSFALLYELYYFINIKFKVNKEFLMKLFSIFIIYGTILAPLFFGVISSKASGDYAGNHDPDYWSADVATLFMPGTLVKSHILFENFEIWSKVAETSHIEAENQNFLGYTLIAISIFSAIIFIFRKRKVEKDNIFSNRYYIIFFFIAALLYLIFALGTKLKFLGNIYSFNLPYHYVYKIIPLVSVPGRFILLTFMSLAVIVAITLNYLSKIINVKKMHILYLIVFILIIAEFIAVPFQLTSYKVPDFYKELALERGDFTILDLSYRNTTDYFQAAGIHMYYQTIHNKKIMDGRISRMPKKAMAYALAEHSVLELEELNVKYIILPIESDIKTDNFVNYLEKNYSLADKDKDIIAYQIFQSKRIEQD